MILPTPQLYSLQLSSFKYALKRNAVLLGMYVDDSGSISYNDNTKNYVLAGAIVEDNKIHDLKKTIFQYKLSNFTGGYIDAEIHTHDIFKGRRDFSQITLEKKYELLDKLYSTIAKMDIKAISVIIDKQQMQMHSPSWKVLHTAWIYLFQRFDRYINSMSGPAKDGFIKIDKSTHKQQLEIHKIINGIRKETIVGQGATHVNKDPVFVNSEGVEGIQVADAIAYCTMRHKSNSTKFEPYWNMIYKKFITDDLGIVSDYGIKESPNKKELGIE